MGQVKYVTNARYCFWKTRVGFKENVKYWIAPPLNSGVSEKRLGSGVQTLQ